jgi:hypothetical protein
MGTSPALKFSKENDHGQNPLPEITYPNGKYLCGCKFDKSIDTRLAKTTTAIL